MEEVLRPKGHEWNVDFIATICTFELQKTLDLKKIVENFIKEKTKYEATFIPWNKKLKDKKQEKLKKVLEKPILLKKPPKKEDNNKFSNSGFENIDFFEDDDKKDSNSIKKYVLDIERCEQKSMKNLVKKSAIKKSTSIKNHS